MKNRGRTLLIACLSLFAASALMAKQEDIPGATAQPAEYFYTGKPYDADLGAYTFAFRNYSPEINRWTSMDPSGFPDAGNNFLYVATPTFELDPDGQKTVSLYQSWIAYSTHEASYLGGGLAGAAAGGATLAGFGAATLVSGGSAVLIGGAAAASALALQYDSWAAGIDTSYKVGEKTSGDYVSYTGTGEVPDDWVCKDQNPPQIIADVVKSWSLGWTAATFEAKIYSSQTFQWGPE